MRHSTDRILTTHVGSLPRPDGLAALLRQKDAGDPVDEDTFQASVTAAVTESVAQQIADGVDVVSDGEMSKMSYHVYTKHRLTGLHSRSGKGVPGRPRPLDMNDFPEMIDARKTTDTGPARLQSVVCDGEVAYGDRRPLERDIENMRRATAKAGAEEAFMTTASPGLLSNYVPNMYYPDDDAYRDVLVEAMRPEYEAIHAAGFLVQLDCPDLAGSRHTDQQSMTDGEFLAYAEKSVEAMNVATAGIPADAMRLHICWLNYPGPHTHDFPVSKLMGLLAKARPQALLFEGANPRHEHEWEDWKAAKLPDDKILVPGVVDSTSNFVEHPRLIAQRIKLYADAVGRERVIAGTDCGFGTYVGTPQVFPSVVRAKLAALAEGAKLASTELWT